MDIRFYPNSPLSQYLAPHAPRAPKQLLDHDLFELEANFTADENARPLRYTCIPIAVITDERTIPGNYRVFVASLYGQPYYRQTLAQLLIPATISFRGTELKSTPPALIVRDIIQECIAEPLGADPDIFINKTKGPIVRLYETFSIHTAHNPQVGLPWSIDACCFVPFAVTHNDLG